MKHILLFIATVVLACSYISCSEEKIEMYNQEPRINFNQSIVYGELTDTDYVKMKTDPYRVDSFRVRIQGDLLTSSRDLCVKQSDNSEYQNSLELLIDDKYTFSKLDGVEQKFYFKVKRPHAHSSVSVFAFSGTSSIVPTLKNAASGYSSASPLIMALKLRMVSLSGTYIPLTPVNFSATLKG